MDLRADGKPDWGPTHAAIRATLLERFANVHSLALQQSLWEMGRAVLERCPDVASIELVAPNIHHVAVDLSPFGLESGRGVPRDRPAVRPDRGRRGARRGGLMEFLSPATLADALAARAEHPGAVPIMGGTDVMVELNFDRHRPPALLDLPGSRTTTWDRGERRDPARRRVTYTRVVEELAVELPGLRSPARSVPADPQPRHGRRNLGAASPAGDAHLLAAFAEVELSSLDGYAACPRTSSTPAPRSRPVPTS